MVKTIKFRHFGPAPEGDYVQPELPALSAKELADRAKKSIASLRNLTRAHDRSMIAEARAKFSPATAWVAWAFAERESYRAPKGATVQFREEGNQTIAQFHTKHHVHGYWSKVGFPRSYRGNGTWISETDEYRPIGPAIVVPAHCRQVSWVDVWHLAHQAGATVAELAGLDTRWERDSEGMLALGALAEPATAEDVAARPAAFLAALRARVVIREARWIGQAAEQRNRDIAAFPDREARVLRDHERYASADDGIGEMWRSANGAQEARNTWWQLAKDARDLGLVAERDRCAARALRAHRAFTQRRRAEETEQIERVASLRASAKLHARSNAARLAARAEEALGAAVAGGIYEDEVLWRGRLASVLARQLPGVRKVGKWEGWAEAWLAGESELVPAWGRTRTGGYRRAA